jgi:hypothetical protein
MRLWITVVSGQTLMGVWKQVSLRAHPAMRFVTRGTAAFDSDSRALFDDHELIDHGTATRNKLRCDADRMNA